jgi:hypothetical protein
LKSNEVKAAEPFCTTPIAKRAYAGWTERLEALGVELGEPDTFLVGLLASREARLQELARDLARRKDESRRLKIISAERLAAQDMAKALDQAERIFGSRVTEDVPEAVRKAMGKASVVPFPKRPGSVTGQRIVVALTKAGALRKDALRRAVSGSQGDFLRGLKEALQSGAVVREGSGTKIAPYTYRAVLA